MSDKDRETFEAWAFEYLKGQYSFYNDATIRDMMMPYKSERRTLEAAWQAARAHYAPKLSEKEFTDALNIATIEKWRGGSMGTTMEWYSYIKDVVAALRAAGVQFRH